MQIAHQPKEALAVIRQLTPGAESRALDPQQAIRAFVALDEQWAGAAPPDELFAAVASPEAPAGRQEES